MEVKSWKQQQADRTHEQLLENARVLFVEKGYAATSLEEMTRGALYHHFNDKRARFDAVVARSIEEMDDRVAAVSKARVARQAKPKRHPDRYLEALEVLLDELSDPATRRLVLMDGPAVLGRQRLREWLHGHVFRVVRRVIQTRSEAGLVPPHLVEPLSHLIIGAAQEAALTIGDAADPRKARRDLLEAFRLITNPILSAPALPASLRLRFQHGTVSGDGEQDDHEENVGRDDERAGGAPKAIPGIGEHQRQCRQTHVPAGNQQS